MNNIEYISNELAYEIVEHDFNEVADVETLTEIILTKLKELLK